MDFTKKEIQSAFWQLLEERPFGKITVKAVVARCGVNRNTFYYHFQDLRDLLRTSVIGWLDELFADGAGAAAVVAALSRRRAAVMHVYRSLPRETFIEELGVWVRYAVARCVGEGRLFAEKENRELLLSVCRFALLGFLLDWLEGDMGSDLGKSLSRCAELLKNFSLPTSSKAPRL
ncbi:MAG: TetR family transcriptional regulator [Pyramidobacter porci]|uniref:TetR family transcriptional regulator n=1 Tax=Pyramidobacter porci TaxID=2605789 RepID=UPI002A7576E8|nr:TetR family transcriptional regulator [Pyramidobacter porci]MDY2648605.1 TetR family transcriptional regulator [Pyramidobacter porci]